MKRSVSRLISTLLALCMALALLPGTALALHGESDIVYVYPVTGGNIYFDPATGTVTDCDESVRAAIIPAEIDGVPVIAIGESAFFSCSNMISVTIPDSVSSIGADAFHWCRSLSDVTIPASVTSIGAWAFYGCKNLVSAHIPGSVTSIGPWTFANCPSLSEMHIPDGVTSIGENAFYSCSNLTFVYIPASVNRIGEGAFSDCGSLGGFEMASENTAYISDDCALLGADRSLLLTYPAGQRAPSWIPTSVTRIGAYAFQNCSYVTGVTIPDGATSIGEHAFSGCTNLTFVTIPASVSGIGTWAFANCGNLTSVSIPEGVTSIGEYTFSGCTSLRSVAIPASVDSIGENAFADCSSLRDIYYAGSESQWQEILISRPIKGANGNATLRDATIHYNSTAPASSAGVSVIVGDKAVVWTDATPFIDENNRTMVPLRAVGNAMAIATIWEHISDEAVFNDGLKAIYFPIGSTTARTGIGDHYPLDATEFPIDGTVEMDTAAVIRNDRIYAPIRYLAEFFGYEVGWDAATRTVIIK